MLEPPQRCWASHLRGCFRVSSSWQATQTPSNDMINKGGSGKGQHWEFLGRHRMACPGTCCPLQPGYPDRWHLALKLKELKEVPKKGLWLRQNFHFSAQLQLSLQSWKHSLPSDEMRPWRLHHSLSHFSLSGLQTTTFPRGWKYYFIYLLIVTG